MVYAWPIVVVQRGQFHPWRGESPSVLQARRQLSDKVPLAAPEYWRDCHTRSPKLPPPSFPPPGGSTRFGGFSFACSPE